MLIGDIDAEVGKRRNGDSYVNIFLRKTCNEKKREGHKLTSKRTNGSINNETDFIMSHEKDTVQNGNVTGNVRVESDDGSASCETSTFIFTAETRLIICIKIHPDRIR